VFIILGAHLLHHVLNVVDFDFEHLQ
jgi:hypothetical protein